MSTCHEKEDQGELEQMPPDLHPTNGTMDFDSDTDLGDPERSKCIPLSELKKWNWLNHLEDQFLENVRMAYVFYDCAALVTTDDEVFMVGMNRHGSLGSESDIPFNAKVPIVVSALCNQNVKGFAFCLQDGSDTPSLKKGKQLKPKKRVRLTIFALTGRGEVYGWGCNEKGTVGIRRCSPNPVKPSRVALNSDVVIRQLACGGGHSLALTTEGTVYAWGRGFHGQIGDGTLQDHPFPVDVKLDDIVMVACGQNHSVALSASGNVYTWGINEKGQLGNGEGDQATRPTVVSFFQQQEQKVKKVASGKDHVLALTANGDLYAWGCNKYGQLGQKENDVPCSKIPLKVTLTLENKKKIVRDIAAVAHNCITVCQSDGVVYMWGELQTKKDDYECPNPWDTFLAKMSDAFCSFAVPPLSYEPITGEEAEVPMMNGNGLPSLEEHIPVDLMKWRGLSYIDKRHFADLKMAFVCGSGVEQMAILVKHDDSVYTCGKNLHGSLGLEITEEYVRKPTKVSDLSGLDFTFGLEVDSGIMCLFALTASGAIFSWGYNDLGELGLGHRSQNVPRPTRIRGSLDNVKIKKVTSGADHVLAISDSNELYAWGYNVYGQVGSGSDCECVVLPARVEFQRPQTKVICAAAGTFHSVAVTQDGEVYSWGSNEARQLGKPNSGKEKKRSSPGKVNFPGNVKICQVICGADNTFALSLTKDLYHWGYCQITNTITPVPTPVTHGTGVTEIVASHWSSIYSFKTETGKVYVWGKKRGSQQIQEVPQEESRAKSISDALIFFSYPPAMISPFIIKDTKD